MSLPVQDVGEFSLPKADDDTDEDYFGFTAVYSDDSNNRPVNNTNKNERERDSIISRRHEMRVDRFQ